MCLPSLWRLLCVRTKCEERLQQHVMPGFYCEALPHMQIGVNCNTPLLYCHHPSQYLTSTITVWTQSEIAPEQISPGSALTWPPRRLCWCWRKRWFLQREAWFQRPTPSCWHRRPICAHHPPHRCSLAPIIYIRPPATKQDRTINHENLINWEYSHGLIRARQKKDLTMCECVQRYVKGGVLLLMPSIVKISL